MVDSVREWEGFRRKAEDGRRRNDCCVVAGRELLVSK